VEASAIASAPAFVDKRRNIGWTLGLWGTVTLGLLVSIFIVPGFPDCYRQGTVTSFKRITELSISALLMVGIVHISLRRSSFNRYIYQLIIASIAATIASELTFTLYPNPTDTADMIGHLLKISSYVFLYRAVLAYNLESPYTTLFQDLVRSREGLREARDELEDRVSERTADLAEANTRLNREIRERRQAERELRSSEERLRFITETIDDVFWMSTPNVSKMVYVSPGYDRLWGRPREELYEDAAPFLEAVHPEDRAHVAANPDGREAGARGMTYRIVRPDGSIRWIEDRRFPVNHPKNNKPLGLVGIASDITEVVALQDQIRRHSDELESQVAERTRLLSEANRKLLRDLEKRERAERLKTVLSEINTVLLSGGEPDEVMERVLKKAAEALGAETAAIAVRENDRWVARHLYGLPEERRGVTYTDQDAPHATTVLQHGKPLAIEDAFGDSRANVGIMKVNEIRSMLILPITLRGGWLGVIYFNYHSHKVAFCGDQIGFLDNLGTALSLSLETSRVLKNLRTELHERARVERELKWAQDKLAELVRRQQIELLDTKDSLAEETGQRKLAELALTQRQQALEAVYSMATTFGSDLENLFDQIALSIGDILEIPFVGIHEFRDGRVGTLSQVYQGTLLMEEAAKEGCAGCDIVRQVRGNYQYRGELRCRFPGLGCCSIHDFHAFIGVPILSTIGEVVGSICAMGFEERTFTEYETHLIEIFARYVGHEVSRRRLQEQLRQSQEMRLLGSLTSGVAHEVRNPLNAIMAIMEALFQEIGENPEYDPYLTHMKTQVNRLSTLMEELLTLGRPIRREQMREVRFAEVIRDSALASEQAQEEYHPIRVSIAPDIEDLVLMADRTKLEQVFVNLLHNAAQHSPVGAEITITAASDVTGAAAVTVTDSGSGIPEELLPRLFEPFYTTRKAGTGLGLSIVRHIVESHGGGVSIQNNVEGAGATARVWFPQAA
ncbi:MAG: GAF domain-containing protein, partial [Chitinivibrionales bacterium]|nr:GAF domain-containing protein [Chitinivibrionales bacterium]MBD3357378.1 GAF domain-containing protein [Chitinivibrionales bacterium]